MATPPHILMLSMDGCRFDALGCYGNERARTPHLDRLAAEGVVFDRAYCSQPICMPCRSSVITGQFPRAHGVWDNGVPLDPGAATLGQALADGGYRTACFGKFHFQPWLNTLEPDESAHRSEVADHGPYYGFQETAIVDHSEEDDFSRWVRRHHPEHAHLALNPRSDRPTPGVAAWKSTLPAEASKTRFIADRTIDFLQQPHEQPFLLWASFIDPHHPYSPPRPYADWYDDVSFEPPIHNDGPPADRPAHYRQWQEQLVRGPWQYGDAAQSQWPNIRRMYQGKVSHVDAEIGRILTALEQSGLAENTIVVFFSDHGAMLGELGLLQIGPYSIEPMVRIPMIWRVPGALMPTAAGQHSQALASAIDLMPTLLDLAGVEAPLGVQGCSLRHTLEQPGREVRQSLLVENRWDQDPPDGYRTLITPRYKLSLYANGEEGELYDLQTDPHETTNRFADPQATDLRRELGQQMAVELMRCENPLPRRVGAW